MDSQPPYDLATIPPHPQLVANYARFDVRFVSGEGCWLVDDRGRRFLDCLSGIAVNALGHRHPGLTRAICAQAEQLLHTSNLFHIAPQEQLAERICANCFGEQVYFCNSGAEANESALKLVRLWGNKRHGGSKSRVIAAEGSFHGRTMGALSLTGNPAHQAGFEPLLPVDFVPYGDAAALAQAMGPDVAGLFLEPMQGESGVNPAPDGYLAAARELCDANGSLLCFDEVQVGTGRTGRMYSHQWDGVAPDCMTLAKALGGGVPIGALVTAGELGDLLAPGTHASTFGGNHLACAAGVAVMDALAAPGFLDAVAMRGERLMQGLRELFGDRALDVRGRGMLVGVQLPESPKPLMAACLRQGLVCGLAGGNVLRLAPPLVIDDAEIDELLGRLAAALD
ncbi:MAG: aspartate aminotransferase family protein [Planctomycetota bacterium]